MKRRLFRVGGTALCLGSVVALGSCRIEKLRIADTTNAANEPGAGIPPCGVSAGSRVTQNGIGALRIGATLDTVRLECGVISEHRGANDAPMVARIDLGKDTASAEFINGLLSRITLYHQAYHTADSLGVGTSMGRLMRFRQATGITERNRLYAITPAQCGLRFMLMNPAPARPAAQSGRAALRRLPAETRTRELEIVGCAKAR